MNELINFQDKDIKNIIFDLNNAIKIFDNLDISETTRKDYKYRVVKFIDFINKHGLTYNSYLDYKKYLSKENLSIASKNKYLIVFRCRPKKGNW